MQRKRFIKILALGACGSAFLNAHNMASHPMLPIRWSGYLLGSTGSLTLYSKDSQHAKKTLSSVFKEIQRLEQKFSLYLADSEINQLNQHKVLLNPNSDWLDLLDRIQTIHKQTHGLFDPTIQTLWNVHKNSKTQDLPLESLSKIGWHQIHYSKSEIRILNKDCEISLNGIAQGYITDKATDILKNEGFQNALVELGETKALGQHPKQRPFQIGIQKPKNETIEKTIELNNQAIATSSSFGSYLLENEQLGHIINPTTGKTVSKEKTISVIAESATTADALSTALILFSEDKVKTFKSQYPYYNIIVT